MQQYDHYIFKMEADSIADCFWADGVLGGDGMPPHQSRDSIRKFLKSFNTAEITLISNRSTSSSIEFSGDTAIQKGRYEQKALVNSDTAVFTGHFQAKWLKDNSGRWLLKKMYTVPDNK